MHYFVTGATGFIGRFVVARLLEREDAVVHVLVREASREKFAALQARLGASDAQLKPVWGDITEPGLTDAATRKALKGKVDHVYHLAAVYDLNMDDATGDAVNNEGTRNVVGFVNELGGKTSLQHVSSVAVAGGEWVGNFSEDMFDEGQDVSHPYFRTKFESEQIVRQECKQPWRVYRPGAVVGSSQTGEMDKIDGPYYFFKTIQRITNTVPKWLPLLGVEGGKVPLAPVDYVADAIVEIAHQQGRDGQAFHLIQKPQDSVGQMMEILFDAAHGPGFAKQFELPQLPAIVQTGLRETQRLLPLNLAMRQMARALGIPSSALGYITNKTCFDDRRTREALAGTGISCPPLREYAGKLWDYWATVLDYPEPDRRATARLAGKIVMVTGASSGIGFESARKFAANGATVILVARSQEKLDATVELIHAKGGSAAAYSCDLNDMEAIDAMAEKVLADYGRVDLLVNNAGRSIRRAVIESLDRFHDVERTLQLNYLGAVRLIHRLLPGMAENRRGQIINISSIGVLSNAPRFAAYIGSKSALDAYCRCLAAEVKMYNIEISTIYMPLVRTPMIAPTKLYNYVPAYSVDAASDMVIDTAVHRTKRVKTAVGRMAEISYALAPRVNDNILGRAFQLFPSSSAAKGQRTPDQKVGREGMALAYLLRGSHL